MGCREKTAGSIKLNGSRPVGIMTAGQVQKMVKTILKVDTLPKLDDITDAMAVAICHAHSHRFAEPIK